MSVLMELTIFPTDKGESLSAYVARIVEMIDNRGLEYRLTPMGTIIELESTRDALEVVGDAYALLEHDCVRVYVDARLDIRKGRTGRLTQKTASVEKHLGRKART